MPQEFAGFDLDGAKAAGYSDDDILKALSSAHGFDADAALQAGYSKSEIINHLSGVPGAASQPGSQQQSNSEQVTDKSSGVPTPISGMLRTPGQPAPATPKASLPSDLPGKAVDAALTALPYVGATAAGIATGGAGFIPEVLAAAAGGGAGSLVEQAGRAITGIRPPASLNDAGNTAAKDALAQGATELGGKAIGSILANTVGKYLNAERLYQSALKPSGANQDVAARTVKAGIDNGIVLNDGAPAVVEGKINDLNQKIKNVIAQTPTDIPPAQYVANIQAKFDALRNQWGRAGTNGADYMKQIDDGEKSFLLREGNPQPTVINGNVVQPKDMDLATLRQNVQPISSDSAQTVKQSTYRDIRARNANAWNPGVNPGLQNEMDQEIGRAMKEELENVYPGISLLNRNEGALIQLDRAVDLFVKRNANKQINPYFIWPMAAGAAGITGVASGSAEAGVGAGVLAVAGHITRQMLEDPAVKSQLAIVLKKAAAMPGAGIATKVLSPQLMMRGAEYAGDATSNHGMVMLKAPDGMLKAVPADQVPHYLEMGATRVQ
jgi:hypothetical protein